MVREGHPAVIKRPQRFCRCGLHPPPAPEYLPPRAQGYTGQGRLGPCLRLYGGTIWRFGHCVELRRTVGIIEHLTRLGEQRLDVFPAPLGPSPDDTPPYGLRGDHTGVLHLRQGLAQCLFGWHLVPTEPMDEALTSAQGEANPLGCTPLVAPARPARPGACLPGAAPARALRARRSLGLLHPEHQHRTAQTARGDLSHTRSNLLARWRHLHHTQVFGHLGGERVPALPTDGHPREPATQG